MRWFGAPATIALLGCLACVQTPQDVVFSLAVVYGNVTSADSVPVTGASVNAFILIPTRCNESADSSSSESAGVLTDPDGRYRMLVAWLNFKRIEECLAVRARPPLGSNLAEATITGVRVEFRSESIVPPLDSVRVDLILPKRP